MLYTGLGSVTFRKLQPRDIVKLVRTAGLNGIEWGGDIHVPPGNLHRAREVAMLTRDAGLQVPSYGSYYRVGEFAPVRFESVLETARLLGTPVIRVWAGARSPHAADSSYWTAVLADAYRIAELAAKAGIQIAFEFHGGTLTETNESAERLLQEANATNPATASSPQFRNTPPRNGKTIGAYWQPNPGVSFADQADGLARLLPWLVHVHVSSIAPTGNALLEERVPEWTEHVATLRTTGRDHYLMLEFVRGDSPESFARDAAVLRQLVATA
jgi:3-dehydroshikimate dehydratase